MTIWKFFWKISVRKKPKIFRSQKSKIFIEIFRFWDPKIWKFSIRNFEILGSQKFGSKIHSSGRNFMNFLSIFKNPVPNIIRRSSCIHFRRENTADDNLNQKCAATNKNVHLSSEYEKILDYPFPEYIQLIIWEAAANNHSYSRKN